MGSADAGLAAALSGLVASSVVGASEQQIVDRGVRSLVDLLPVQGAGATLGDGGRTAPVVAASDPTALTLEGLQSQLGEGPCVIARHVGEPCLAPDIVSDRRFTRYGSAAARSGVAGVFAFPLRFGVDDLGAIDLYTTTAGSLTDDAVASAHAMSEALASCLVNARDRAALEIDSARLRDAVGHDSLTGLVNRRLFVDRVQQALRRRARSGRTVAVALLDVDGLKSVNDTHGHRVGDELLVALAQRLTTAVRPTDTLGRLSGDEFVVLFEDLPAADEVDALLSRIDDCVSAPFRVAGTVLDVSLSYGHTVSLDPGDSPASLIDAADRAMYRRKRLRPHAPRTTAPATQRLAPDGPGAGERPPRSPALDAHWTEWWIDGPSPSGGTFTHVMSRPELGELQISEFDRRTMLVRRWEWLPAPGNPEPSRGAAELIVTDWEGEEIARRAHRVVPSPPRGLAELTQLLSGLDLRG